MANGVVWTGVGAETRDLFPPLSHLRVDDMPIENKLTCLIHDGTAVGYAVPALSLGA